MKTTRILRVIIAGLALSATSAAAMYDRAWVAENPALPFDLPKASATGTHHILMYIQVYGANSAIVSEILNEAECLSRAAFMRSQIVEVDYYGQTVLSPIFAQCFPASSGVKNAQE